MYVCMYSMNMFIFRFIHMHLRIHKYMHTHIPTYIYIHMPVSKSVNLKLIACPLVRQLFFYDVLRFISFLFLTLFDFSVILWICEWSTQRVTDTLKMRTLH